MENPFSSVVDELNSIFDEKKLPSLKAVLNISNSVKIGTVSAIEMEATYMIAHNDMSKIIKAFKEHRYRDATELTMTDALKIAGVFGVPGAAIAGTVSPYLFDMLNAELDGKGRIDRKIFIDALEHAQSNMAQISKDIKEKNYTEAAQLTIDDLLDAAYLAGGGPYAIGAKIVVNIGFAIVKNKNVQDFLVNIGMGIEEIGSIFDDLDKTLLDLEGHPHIDYKEGRYNWDPFKGWVWEPKLVHHITKDPEKRK